MNENKVTQIYCDGACSGNQFKNNEGGWGVVILRDDKPILLSGKESNTTNQKMELQACIEALKHLKNSENLIKIFSDSAYLVNCINDKWYIKWQKNGWVNSKKEKVANKDLWEKLLKLISHKNVTFQKVKGHSGNKWNEVANNLAQNGK